MTISSNVPRVSFVCNGVTTDFPFPYPVLLAEDLTVLEVVDLTGIETEQFAPTNYTIVETPEADGSYPSGVTVQAVTAPDTGRHWIVINDPSATQGVDLTDNGALPVDAQVERPFDRVTLLIQRALDKINRAVRQPEGDVDPIGLLPPKAQRVNTYAGYDGDGDPAVLGAPIGTSITTAFSAQLLADASAQDAQATLAMEEFGGGALLNGYFVASAGSNVLTLSIRHNSGNAPSATFPVYAVVRRNAGFNGQRQIRTITAPVSLTVSAGSTLGTVSGQRCRIYFGILDDSGTIELWAMNPLLTQASLSYQLKRLDESQVFTTTAEGGAGGADSAQIPYSTTARSAVFFRYGGYVEMTNATAGNWSLPVRVQTLWPGVPRTGDIIQRRSFTTTGTGTITDVIPLDSTIPQSGEGDPVGSVLVDPISLLSLMRIRYEGWHDVNGAAHVILALFKNAGANALRASSNYFAATTTPRRLELQHTDLNTDTAQITYFVMGGPTANTMYFGQSAGGATLGGVALIELDVEEIMV